MLGDKGCFTIHQGGMSGPLAHTGLGRLSPSPNLTKSETVEIQIHGDEAVCGAQQAQKNIDDVISLLSKTAGYRSNSGDLVEFERTHLEAAKTLLRANGFEED